MPYTAGGEFLLLLGELQRSGPVAVIVDDAQWMDRPSKQTLAFVQRRLRADRVLTVRVARPGGFDAALERLLAGEQSVRLVLHGLRTDEVAELARRVSGVVPAEGLPGRLREQTEGNPLYLRTLLADLPPEVVGSGRIEQLPVPAPLAQSIQGQLKRLPAASRALVEALAVLDTQVPLAQLAGPAQLEDPVGALGPAVSAGLVTAESEHPACPVRISHDLQRQAVYQQLAPDRRRILHENAVRLADPVAALTHRVAAAFTTDPRLAAELEQAALAEAAAGSYDLAATHLLWAAQLSGNRTDHERRLLTACAQSLRTLRPAWAAQHHDQVLACAPGPLRSCVLGIQEVLGGNLAAGESLSVFSVASPG